MSEFTIHDEKVINHAHFHQESESQGTPPNGTKNVLHRLLAELRGEKRIIAFVDTIPRITGDVGKILDGTTNPAGRSDIPTGFHEIVGILTTNGIKCRIRPTGGLIIGDPRTDRYLQLYLAFDKSTGEYIEHFDGHKLVYTNIFQVLERIEAHDFDIGVHVSGGGNYNRKHLTTGLENAQISGSGPSLISRQGGKLPRNQETNPDSTQGGDARFLITGEKNIINREGTSEGEVQMQTLSEILGTKIPHEIGKNKLTIRYLATDRSRDITILYDTMKSEFRIKRSKPEKVAKEEKTVFSTLSALLVFIVEDYNNIINTTIERFGNQGRYLRLSSSGLSIESGFDSVNSLPEIDADLRKSLPPSSLDIGHIQITDPDTLVRNLIGEIEGNGSPAVLHERLRNYCASIAQSQREKYPDQYQVIRGDSEGLLLGTAILMKALINSIARPLPEYTPDSLVHIQALATIQTYITLRQTLADETMDAIWGYLDKTDTLSLDQNVSTALERVNKYMLANETQNDVEKDLEWIKVKSKVEGKLQSLGKHEQALRDELIKEMTRMRNPYTFQEEIDKGSELMKKHPNRVKLLDLRKT